MCDSDQIAMSSHNVQTSLFRFFRRDAAIWVDTINRIQKTGADPGFQVRGGGGTHLKKIEPSEGLRENVWGISCEYFFSNFKGAGPALDPPLKEK